MNTAIHDINTAIKDSFARSEIPPHPVEIIAVSKTQPVEAIIPIIEQGHTIFGENRVQECTEKWEELKQRYPHIQLHFIGTLQKNKVKYLANLVDCIHTVDSEGLALEIRKHMDKNPQWKPQCFIQVNTGDEPQKSGVAIQETDALIQYCRDTVHLPINGLMCIPPVQDNPALHFALLRKICLLYTSPSPRDS